MKSCKRPSTKRSSSQTDCCSRRSIYSIIKACSANFISYMHKAKTITKVNSKPCYIRQIALIKRKNLQEVAHQRITLHVTQITVILTLSNQVEIWYVASYAQDPKNIYISSQNTASQPRRNRLFVNKKQ